MASCKYCKKPAKWVQVGRRWKLMDEYRGRDVRHVCGRVDAANTNVRMEPTRGELSRDLKEEARRIAGIGGWV